MITIEARRDEQTWNEAVRASGNTLPHAVRVAARKLGLGTGRTLTCEKVGHAQWKWNWSGKTIFIVKV